MSLNRQQLCAELNISESTVRRLEREGLPHTPTGRSSTYDLEACRIWLRQRTPSLAPVPAVPVLPLEAFSAVLPPVPETPRLSHAAVLRFHAGRRRAVRIQRTPPWADEQAIRAIYAQAQIKTLETGIPHHVDHAIPLQGRLVSGLHVEGNLQILTASENSRKRNKYEVDA